MKAKIVLAFIFVTALISCSRTLYMPASPDAAKQEQLLAGRKLYVDHCSSCHNLHLPNEYKAEGWKKQLDEMQVKAKISDAEKQLIFEYLTSTP